MGFLNCISRGISNPQITKVLLHELALIAKIKTCTKGFNRQYNINKYINKMKKREKNTLKSMEIKLIKNNMNERLRLRLPFLQVPLEII